MDQKPSVGRIVHYTLSNNEVRPAIIVRVWSDECVQLQVFLDNSNDRPFISPGSAADTGLTHGSSVTRADGPTPGKWHWPERV